MTKDFDPRTYKIIGAAIEVQRVLGHGFSEKTYQCTMGWEMEARKIPFEREVPLPVKFKGREVPFPRIADFLAYDDVIIETKANQSLTPADESQLLHYLRASNRSTGLLLNFGRERLETRRYTFKGNAFVLL